MSQHPFIFLDRDGVLNTERKNYTYSLEHFSMVANIGEALATLRDKGFRFVVVTNQSGIAKGIYQKADMEKIHRQIDAELAKFKVEIECYYYCPHHPTKTRCLCRKPNSQMLEKAIARFQASKKHSWFIGDKERDIEAGQKAGLNTLQIDSNEDLFPKIDFLTSVLS